MGAEKLELQIYNNWYGGEKASSGCPRCYSGKVWKDGRRKTKKGLVQRYICRVCDYRFSGALILSFDSDLDVEHQVGVAGNGAKNLIVAKEEKIATG